MNTTIHDHTRRRAFVILLISTFAVSQLSGWAGRTVYGAPAATTPAQTVSAPSEISTLSSLSSLQLRENFSVKLNNASIFPQDSGNILTYTLTYTNSSSSGFNLINYFSKVVTPGGAIFKGTPVMADTVKKNVASKESVTVTCYANVGNATSVKGIKIQMFGWNFSTANYEQRIGTFTIPSNYSVSALKGESKKIEMNSIPVLTKAESVQLYKYNGKVYAKVGISMSNLGTKVLTDPGYTYYLKSSGGSIFTLAQDDSSISYKVLPREKKMIYYMTEIPAYINTTNLTLQMVKPDETLKLYLPVAFFNLPAAVNADFTVASYATKNIMLDHNRVEMQLQKSIVHAQNDNGIWEYQLRVKNAGSQAVTLPAYELSVISAEGYKFPIKTTAFSSLALKPLEEKLIQLNASVPLNLAQNKLQLRVIEPASSGDAVKLILPVAYFTIPYSLEANTYLDSERFITNDYGSFGVNVASLQRLPWGDKDLVTAKLNIRNTTSNKISLPDLTGILKVDQHDLTKSTQIIMDDYTSVLAPGESTSVSLLANIPYTLDFSQTKIILLEKDGDNTSQFLSLSTTVNAVSVIHPVEAGGAIKFDSTGKKSSLQERLTTVYKGKGSNIVYSEAVMNSEEARQANLSRLYAYFKTKDGQYFQASSNQTEATTSPGGQTLITFWSKVPSTVDLSSLELYVGQGVAAGKLTEAETKATGYINTSALVLNNKETAAQKNLVDGLVMFPYTLNIVNAAGSMTKGGSSINLNFTYKLSKDNTYDMGDYEHKLIMEFTDPYGQSFEKTLAYGTDLTEGNSSMYAASYTSNLYKSLSGGTFRIRLYDEFHGQRNELGSQAYLLDVVSTKPSEK